MVINARFMNLKLKIHSKAKNYILKASSPDLNRLSKNFELLSPKSKYCLNIAR